MLATTYTFALGKGDGETKLDSFDSALMNTGIGNLNLIKVSSILPADCTYCATPKWIEGQAVQCVYASYISNIRGETISAAVGVAKPKTQNLPGVITKYSGNGSQKISEKTVEEMCIRAMKRRAIEDYEIVIHSVESKIGKHYGCVFAGVILNDDSNSILQSEGQVVNWRCLGAECPNNCCGPFTGLQASLKPISNVSHSDIILLPEDMERLLKISRKDLVKKQGSNCFLRVKQDGTCYALAQGRCTIYDSRPTLCRAYPFYIDLFTGVSIHTTCPGIGRGMTPLDEIRPYLKAAKTVYDFWLRKM